MGSTKQEREREAQRQAVLNTVRAGGEMLGREIAARLGVQNVNGQLAALLQRGALLRRDAPGRVSVYRVPEYSGPPREFSARSPFDDFPAWLRCEPPKLVGRKSVHHLGVK